MSVQGYVFYKSPTESIYIAKEYIEKGEKITKENLTKIEIDKNVISQFNYSRIFEEFIAKRDIYPGEAIVKELLIKEDSILTKGKDQRYVTFKFGIVQANGWIAEKGDIVELIHVNFQEYIKIKILKNVIVYDYIYYGNDEVPSYIILLVNEEQRTYILENREIGNFEISM